MKTRVILFIFVFCFLLSQAASAQISSTDGIELSISTNNPVPGQKVTITARSYSIDIDTARVNWIVNGSSIQNDIGKTSLDVTAPALGKKISVTVRATTPEGIVVGNEIIIGSGYVDLITETDGYVPPFFKGKLFPVYQNQVKIVAIPHLANSAGVEYDPKTLIYQWKRNGQAISNQSGYGKQSIVLTGAIIPRPFDLSVSVWPRDESSTAEGFIQMSAVSPSLVFYADDSLYGPLFNKAIDGQMRIGSQKEIAVLASPFGFNRTGDTDENLSWSWVINGTKRAELSSNESVVLRAPEVSIGTSDIQLEIINTDKILQGAKNNFSAHFNTTARTESEVIF